MKDNDHITHGYRINFDTPRKIIKSLFMWHNESVNIWTHFLPALTIIIVLVYFFVDFESLKQSYNSYSLSVGQSIDHYSHALDNLTLLAEYDKFKEITKHEFE